MSKASSPKASPIDLNDKHNKEDELGTLIVVLLKARNLNDKHSFYKSDVFAQATLNGAQKRTHVDAKGGQHPEWDGEVRFPILKSTAAKHRKMEVACYSQEPRSEDLMGKGIVDITETLRTGEFDDWVQLEVDGVARGELYLEMTYYANAPAPIAPAPSNKLLSVVQNQSNGLTRRPSKLSPSDRLSRPHQQQQVGRPQNQDFAQGHPPPQGYQQPRPQATAPSKYSASPSHSSRLSEQYTSPRHGSTTMPGSYPDGSSNGSPPKGKYSALPAIPVNELPYAGDPALSLKPGPQAPGYGHQQQQPAPLPSILRPGPGGSPTPIPRPQQNGLGHGRHSSDSSFVLNASRYGPSQGSQGSPPNHNPYIGGSGNSSNSASQPSSPPLNPYIGGSASPPNPYIGGSASPPNPYIAGGGTLSPGQVPARAYSPAPMSLNNGAPPPNAAPITSPVQGQGQNSYTGYHPAAQQPSGPPLIWRQDTIATGPPPSSNGSFSFPMPAMAPVRDAPSFAYVEGGHNAYNSRPSAASGPQSMNVGYHQRPSRDERDFDPYLQARYQTPLPLPPGTERPASAPAPASASALAPAHWHASAPSKKPSTPAPDRDRLEALRRAEENAARRREQELKDLELAMQLDRELNLAEERATATSSAGR
ncbi:hypothetical protein BDZ97DRAFT_1783276 [Flammula alnicola]|nr:hypothetical protein BDZ97DRAFT_1783276 [Flammula alnicola]